MTDDHVCVWGPLERSRMAGTVHRKCQVPGCRMVGIGYDDDEDDGACASDYTCARADCSSLAVVVYQGPNHPAIYGACAEHQPWENPADGRPKPFDEYTIIHGEPVTIHTPVMGWQSCRYVYEGNDPEDGDYYRCLTHDPEGMRLTLGHDVSCENASYIEQGQEPPT